MENNWKVLTTLWGHFPPPAYFFKFYFKPRKLFLNQSSETNTLVSVIFLNFFILFFRPHVYLSVALNY